MSADVGPRSPCDGRASPSPPLSFASAALFLLAFNATLVSAIIASQLSHFLPAAILYFAVAALLVTAAQVAALGAVWRWLSRRRALAATAFGALCLMSVRYCFIPALISAGTALKAAMLVAVFTGGFAFIRFPAARYAAYVFLVLFAIQNWLFATTTQLVRGPSTPPVADAALVAATANLRDAKRNLYVLLFDAMVSDEAFAVLFKPWSQLADLPWKPALLAEGMAHYRSAYSPAYVSQSSFYRMLSLGTPIVDDRDVPRGFFGGSLPVPAYDIARAAGLRSEFLSSSSYFGVKSGHHVDYFFPERVTGLCAFVATEFLGIACRRWMLDLARELGIDHQAPGEFAVTPTQETSLLPQIERRVLAVRDSGSNWLTIAYVWTPGHVLPEHDFRDKRDVAKYIALFDREAVETARIAAGLVRMIKSIDPRGVIVVAGDHGARLTQRGESELPEDVTELDWRGVGFFVYPPTECAAVFRNPGYDLGYILRDLYSCVRPAQ